MQPLVVLRGRLELARCRFPSFEWGTDPLVIIDLLSPNMYVGSVIGTPRYRRLVRMSFVCWIAVRPAMNSAPNVADSTVACFLE